MFSQVVLRAPPDPWREVEVKYALVVVRGPGGVAGPHDHVEGEAGDGAVEPLVGDAGPGNLVNGWQLTKELYSVRSLCTCTGVIKN